MSTGKKRDHSLHDLLFMPDGLRDGEPLAYCVNGQKVLEGYKEEDGIFCYCCEKKISPSVFEAHAGMSRRRQPYRHIYTSDGLTLHDVSVSLSKEKELTMGDNKEKLGTDRLTATGESSVASPSTKGAEHDVGCCVICKALDFTTGNFDERTMMLCDQCEKEFHVGCLRDRGLGDLEQLPEGEWFCSVNCNRISGALRALVLKGTDMIPAALLSTISRKHAERGIVADESENYVKWQVLRGRNHCCEHYPLLSRAAAIFHECFGPMVTQSGCDLIPVMVYGEKLYKKELAVDQDFGGVYCVVLSVKSVVVSTGLLRIFGEEVAELPLVATSEDYQGKGFFQALFPCIERLLYSVNVEKAGTPCCRESSVLLDEEV